MNADYWLGVATVPAVVVAAVGAFVAWVRSIDWLARRGITFEGKTRRRVDEISDYVLRNNIWWERSFGPLFIGGWYREKGYETTTRHINRWVGLGSVNGPCAMVIRARELPAPEAGE